MDQYSNSFLSVIPDAPPALDAEDGYRFLNAASHFKFDFPKFGKSRFEGSIFDSSSQPTSDYCDEGPPIFNFYDAIDIMEYKDSYPNMGPKRCIKTSHAPQSMNKFSNRQYKTINSFLTKAVARDDTIPYPTEPFVNTRRQNKCRKKKHSTPMEITVQEENAYKEPFQPVADSPAFTPLNPGAILNINDPVYVIDPNGFDIWEGVINSGFQNNVYEIHYPDFPEDDGPAHYTRVLRRVPNNKQIYDEQEMRRNEIREIYEHEEDEHEEDEY